MGNCCSHTGKQFDTDSEHQISQPSEELQFQSKKQKSSSKQSKGDIGNHLNIGDTRKEDSKAEVIERNTPTSASAKPNQGVLNSGSIHNPIGQSPTNQGNYQNQANNNLNGINNPPVQSSNSHHQIGSVLESGSLNGYQGAKHGTIFINKENNDSMRAIEDISSQKVVSMQNQRLDTLEKEYQSQQMSVQLSQKSPNARVQENVVRTIDQLNNVETQKYVFMCKSDTAKSFILHLSHVQAQQPGSTQILFDQANNLIMQTYGTESIGMELMFGMQNLSKPASYHSDSFPAYFKLKEVFEESYFVEVQLPGKIPKYLNQSVFPSMTIEDAKKELCKVDSSLNENSCSMFRILDESGTGSFNINNAASPQLSKLQDRLNNITTSASQQNWIPLLDEEKFGINSHDFHFVIRNMEDETQNESSIIKNEVYWQVSNEVPNTSEIQLIKKGESQRRIVIGTNLECECRNSKCKLNNTKIIKPLGVGLFDFQESSKFTCILCSQPTLIHQILFYQCRYAYSGIQDFIKKSSCKWMLSFKQMAIKRLDQKDILKKATHTHQAWNSFISSQSWSKFKIYSKRIGNYNKLEQNEEFIHTLSMEDISLNKMCGVCRQNVADQMQHTLDCGHAYHRICLNLLPPIFQTIKCPICVKSYYYFSSNDSLYYLLEMSAYDHFRMISIVNLSTHCLSSQCINECLFILLQISKAFSFVKYYFFSSNHKFYLKFQILS